jgi:hypothetical protein
MPWAWQWKNRRSANKQRPHQDSAPNKHPPSETPQKPPSIDKPPSRSTSNTPFCAWAEYLGEEQDSEFVEWKKEMIGEGPQLQSHVEARDAATAQIKSKENKSKQN